MPAAPPFSQRAIPVLLVVAVLLFGTGVFSPFFHVTKFWIFNSGVDVTA